MYRGRNAIEFERYNKRATPPIIQWIIPSSLCQTRNQREESISTHWPELTNAFHLTVFYDWFK